MNGSQTTAYFHPEVTVILKEASERVGRTVTSVEAALGIGAFGYWYVGFTGLSRKEQQSPIRLLFPTFCSFCVEAVIRRYAAEGVIPKSVGGVPLDDYICDSLEDPSSALGAAKQVSECFAERFLEANHMLPFSNREVQNEFPSLTPVKLCRFVREQVSILASEEAAEAFMPLHMITSDGLRIYREQFAKVFRSIVSDN